MLARVLSYFGIFLLTLLSLLPLSVLYIIAWIFYFFVYAVFGYRKKIVRANLRKVFPEKSEAELLCIEKKYYAYLTALVVEIIKMRSISKAELQRRFRFKNIEVLEEYFKKGQSVLICSAHYGNWEWGTLSFGLAISAQNYPIYKPLKDVVFDCWLRKVRSRFGNKMIAMNQTLRALQANKTEATVFCFGNDQSPSKDELNYWTTFLGQPSAVQLGIEKIAKKTNRPVFYLKTTVLKKGYYEVECVPLCLDPAAAAEFEITELHVRLLEKIILEEPAYWLWSHRRWKHQKPALSA
ncbi:lysophospholipid acyltransferase family protein [Pedobacter sp. KR3-3]|uniref:Lysophospholipid acyltransferase family protein n=1 Tax=Pedobacter albus TaxID=3113905 RepID=A0ABU7IBE8_9SPHI|nr:lysophospholipid acyltransferase family protein [Pedobacter sp. KR3-3]MEE1946793.1 lysophospholipid acyltransferase family protein [Pedobacter sp. KR3-3]